MVKLTGMPEADIEKMLDDMSYTGLLEYNWENPERAKQWCCPCWCRVPPSSSTCA